MAWTEEKLLATLDELKAFGEDTTLIECKKATHSMPQNIGTTLSAFANMPEGGTIILGIDERAGFLPTGIDNPAALTKAITSACRNGVTPSPQLEHTTLTIDNKHILIIDVIPLHPSEKPALYQHRAYLRQADGDYVMNSNDLLLLQVAALQATQRVDNDFSTIPATSSQQLDQDLLDRYVKEVRSNRKRLKYIDDREQLLAETGVTNTSGELRLAGLYALGNYPQGSEPALAITASVELPHTSNGARNKNLKHFEGPLPVLLQEAMEWVRHNSNNTGTYDANGNLIDQPEFPPIAIREIIANALVHRDLGPSLHEGKRIEIRLTDTALIIQNPGGLKGLSVSQLESKELAKAAVNQRLYEICKDLRSDDGNRVIEGEGGGIKEVLLATRQHRTAQPRFIDTGAQFKVIIPRGNRFSPVDEKWLSSLNQPKLTPIQQDVLVTLKQHNNWSLAQLQSTYSPYSRRALELDLATLEEKGLIQFRDNIISLHESSATATKRSDESNWGGNEHGQSDNTLTPTPNKHSTTTKQGTDTQQTLTLDRNTPTEAFLRSTPTEAFLRSLGKNVPAVYAALLSEQSCDIQTLSTKTHLKIPQVRYALRPLQKHNLAQMVGGQGQRTTYYSITAREQ